MKPQLTPTLDEFSQLADRGNVIPLFTEFIADGETPVSAFKKLGNPGYSFLFESTEKNDVSGRFSFVGVEPRVIIQSYGREIQVIDRDTEERFDTARSEEHTSELQSHSDLVCRLLLEKKK